jgi:alcohol dehydrogenase class IV
MHALAHPLGAVYNLHHGLLNAILMPYVLKANCSDIEEPITRLSRYLNLRNPGFDSFLSWILAFRESLNIPHRLLDINIDNKDAERIGAMAAADPSAATNPIIFLASEYTAIFNHAVSGQL